MKVIKKEARGCLAELIDKNSKDTYKIRFYIINMKIQFIVDKILEFISKLK